MARLTPNEQGVAGEDHPLVAILHEVADAILSVAGGVKGFDGDAFTDGERLPVRRSLSDRLAVCSTDDGELAEGFELRISAIGRALAGHGSELPFRCCRRRGPSD